MQTGIPYEKRKKISGILEAPAYPCLDPGRNTFERSKALDFKECIVEPNQGERTPDGNQEP
jgi:hypothetical protein